MKNIIGKYIYLVPPIIVLITFVVSFIDINDDDFLILGNSCGYSMLILLPIMYFYLYTGKYCFFTKASVVGLFMISMFNTLGAVIQKYDKSIQTYNTYSNDLSILICLLVFILTSILYIYKTKTKTMKITNWFKKNAIVIIYILALISDMITQFTSTLDLTSNQLNLLKMLGAIVAVISAQLQAKYVERTKEE